MISCLMASKGLLEAAIHFISDPFFGMEVMCFTNSTKFGMNLLIKLILSRKDWMPIFELGMDSV